MGIGTDIFIIELYFRSLASSRVLSEGLVVGAVSFGTLQLGKHGATRPVRLVTSYLWVF